MPEDRRGFFQAHVLTPIRIHQHSLEVLESYCAAKAAGEKNDKGEALARAGQAMRAADDLFAALHLAERGKWAAWYAGDLLVGMEGSRDLVRGLQARLKGEPAPPCRDDNKHEVYPKLYRYQLPFQTNFPLLYPRSNPGGR